MARISISLSFHSMDWNNVEVVSWNGIETAGVEWNGGMEWYGRMEWERALSCIIRIRDP